ncbi:MAG: hypothetical protein ACI85U_001490, partial [Candidatus Promineifilaceae bacterium]
HIIESSGEDCIIEMYEKCIHNFCLEKNLTNGSS